MLDILGGKKRLEISNANRLFVAVLSVFLDIDYAIDLIYGTHYHSYQFIPLSLAAGILSILYFLTEKYRKVIFLCLIALGNQIFGDMLVGVYTYRILAFQLQVIPGNFFLFMVSFEVIMPIILLVFLLIKMIANMYEDVEIGQ